MSKVCLPELQVKQGAIPLVEKIVHMHGISDLGPQNRLSSTLMLLIKQAPLFWLHTSNAPNALYTKVGYAYLHNVSSYNKAENLPL